MVTREGLLAAIEKRRKQQNATQQNDGTAGDRRSALLEALKKRGYGASAQSGASSVDGEYAALTKNKDFATKSRAGMQSFTQSKQKQQEEQSGKGLWQQILEATTAPQYQFDNPIVSGMVASSEQYRKDTSYMEPSDDWSQEQKDIFGYLYSDNTAKAFDYARKVNDAIKGAKEQQQRQRIAENATKNVWAGAGNTAAALLAAPTAIGDFIDNIAEAAGRGTITKKGMLTPYDYSQAVTGGISQKLNEYGTIDESVPVLGGRGWGDVYGLGFSTAQSLLAGASGSGALTMLQFFGQAAASGVDEAMEAGGTAGQALLFGAASGAAEAVAEKIGIDNLFKNSGAKTLKSMIGGMIKQGIAEGMEEGATSIMNTFADQLIMGGKSKYSKAVEQYSKTMGEADAKKKALQDTLEGIAFDMIGGLVSGGASTAVMTGNRAVSNVKHGKGALSGLTKNEQAVVDKVYKDAIAEAEKEGKVSQKRKNEIFDQVIEQMDRGEIDIDTIEQVLGGKTYKAYQDTVSKEDSKVEELEAQIKELEAAPNTVGNSKKYDALQAQLEDLKSKSSRSRLKDQLGREVSELVKQERLGESYAERGRKGQAFQADVSQYDERQRATVQAAIDSGILNNTRRAHEFVDLVAKISADKGVAFNFADNKKLQETGFALEGVTVNGFVNSNGVTVNVNSAKALNSVVGHEIAHVLEGTELYDGLQTAITQYAESKGDYKTRLAQLTKLYEGKEGYEGADAAAKIEREVVADLVGDYLFTDKEFVSRLSAENRTVFEKIFDEVKYLCRIATAGSKEARQLEKVKKAFEEAYRAEGTKNPTGEGGSKYSLMAFEQDGRRFVEIDQDQDRFDGHSVDEYPRIAKDIINEKFNGKVIGIDNKMFVNGSSRDEFSNPSKRIADDLYEAKMRTAGELDNLLDAGTNIRNVPDGEDGHVHPDAVDGFDHLDTLFKIGNRYYEAVVNIKNIKRGKLFKDVTKIKDVTQDIMDSYGDNPKFQFLRTSSMNSIRNPGEVVNNKNSQAEITDAQNENGLDAQQEAIFSLSNDTAYMDKAISANNSALRVDPGVMTEAKAARERVAARMNAIKDNGLVGLPEDIEGNTYIANSSYDGTEENTTICPRSLASEAFVDAVSEYLGRPLTIEEQIYISQDLQGRSMTPECTYCYVATDRKAYRAFLGEYIKQRDAVLQKLKADPDADVTRSGALYKEFLNGRKDTEPMYKRFKMWVDAYRKGTPMVDASRLANISKLMGDINSEFGEALRPQIVDAMKYAQSASWAKKRVNYVAYNGHILKWKQDRINKLNGHYGLRMYSFSDFHPAFVLENMQMITDAAVRGLKMLGYTKDTDFVEIFAPTGMNINVSTFGFSSGGNVYENNIIGAEWEKAKALREKHPNVGVTFVATNDTLVEWALAQDWIDVVIPYHLVRTGAEVAKAFGYTNYTSESADTKDTGWAKGKDKKYIAPTEHNNDKATYLAALEKNHLKPRFERFLDNPNYMKLVNECRQSASESKPVQPVFDENAAMRALAKLEANGYYQPIGGSVDRMYEIAAEVAEDMRKEIAPVMSLSDQEQTDDPFPLPWTIKGEDVGLQEFPLPEGYIQEQVQAAESRTADPEQLAPVPEDVAVKTTREKLAVKKQSLETELAENRRHREESAARLDEKIAKLQAEYDGKKNKDTKYANNLLRRIENLKRRKASIDVDYAKRIGDLEAYMERIDKDLQVEHVQLDEVARAVARIDNALAYDKGELEKEFSQRRQALQDREGYISTEAGKLYEELRSLRKGVRASDQLAQLLDAGYDWDAIRAALVNIKHTPNQRVNLHSEAESHARELLAEMYENAGYDLEDEYSSRLRKLEQEAEAKRKAASVAGQRRAQQGRYEQEAADLAGDTTTWKDKKVGISYQVNTLRRNLRDVVRKGDGSLDIKRADAIYDWLQGSYNRNEAKLNRHSRQIKQAYADMDITDQEDVYIQMLGELRANPETSLTDADVAEYYRQNAQHIDKEKVDKAIEMARKTYDELFAQINAALRQQGMKEIPYRKGYFPHFTEPKQGKLAKLLNWKVRDDSIPTDIAGLTEQFNPNRSWQRFNKERKTDLTDYSFQKGLDNYVHGALDWIYHIEDIQRRRAFENHIRYVHSDEGVRQRVDAIRANHELDAEEAQEQIDAVWKEKGNPLNNFVTDLRTGTNVLAGKKSSMDRGVEGMLNRKVYSVMSNLSNRVSANMVGGSISSALTNFIPITQSWGQVSPVSSLKALGDAIRSAFQDDGMVDKSDFLTNRLRTEEALYKTGWDKISDKVSAFSNAVDSLTAQTVWRSKYMENIAAGMSENQAIRDADQFAENVIAGRSRGNMPTIFASKNPVIKMLTAFQLEVANQYGYMLKDMPQDMHNEVSGKLVMGYAKMFIGAFVYNSIFSALTGRDAAFDPARIISDLLRDLFDDAEEPVEDLLGFAENVLEEVPFVGGLLGGGRVPISSALPYDGVWEAVEGTATDIAEGDWKSLLEEFSNPVTYLLPPVGGGQIRKTAQGISMYANELPGSYTASGGLRFPVQKDPLSVLQAILFGRWSSDNAEQYIDEGRSPLSEKQTQEFRDTGMSIQQYWDYRDGMKGLDTLAQKGDYIGSLDLTVEQKNILINNIAGRDVPIDMTDYDQYPNFEAFDFGSQNPGKYAVAQAVGGYDQYMTYRKELGQIEGDEDVSRKQKVTAYINSLDAEYGEKIILYVSQYPSKESRRMYGYEIVDYLNGRSDIRYSQMVAILQELGFEVSADGKVTWD